jgi:hypothetical protein
MSDATTGPLTQPGLRRLPCEGWCLLARGGFAQTRALVFPFFCSTPLSLSSPRPTRRSRRVRRRSDVGIWCAAPAVRGLPARSRRGWHRFSPGRRERFAGLAFARPLTLVSATASKNDHISLRAAWALGAPSNFIIVFFPKTIGRVATRFLSETSERSGSYVRQTARPDHRCWCPSYGFAAIGTTRVSAADLVRPRPLSRGEGEAIRDRERPRHATGGWHRFDVAGSRPGEHPCVCTTTLPHPAQRQNGRRRTALNAAATTGRERKGLIRPVPAFHPARGRRAATRGFGSVSPGGNTKATLRLLQEDPQDSKPGSGPFPSVPRVGHSEAMCPTPVQAWGPPRRSTRPSRRKGSGT